MLFLIVLFLLFRLWWFLILDILILSFIFILAYGLFQFQYHIFVDSPRFSNLVKKFMSCTISLLQFLFSLYFDEHSFWKSCYHLSSFFLSHLIFTCNLFSNMCHLLALIVSLKCLYWKVFELWFNEILNGYCSTLENLFLCYLHDS